MANSKLQKIFVTDLKKQFEKLIILNGKYFGDD